MCTKKPSGDDREGSRINKITANPQAAVIRSPWRCICFTSALEENTSSKTFVPEKAPLRVQRSVAVPHPGQLLMIRTSIIYISRDSKIVHLRRNPCMIAGRLASPDPHSALVGRSFIQHANDPVAVKAGNGRGVRNKARLLRENSSANAKPSLKAISKGRA